MARIYDCWLGGGENFPADREAADRLAATVPHAKDLARANRDFLNRAVRDLANRGIRQFLDIGSGLPTQDNVHQVAGRVAPDSSVVYVDRDPIVAAHTRALLHDWPQATVVEGDLRYPGEILANPRVRAALDLAEPVGVLLASVLHFLEDEFAYDTVAYLREAIAPGSYLVVSHGALDEYAAVIPTATAIYAQAGVGLNIRRPEDISAFFGDFAILPPGLVSPDRWGTSGASRCIGADGIRSGVARKPMPWPARVGRPTVPAFA